MRHAALFALATVGFVFGALLKGIYASGAEQGVFLFVSLPLFLGCLSTMVPLRMHVIGKTILVVTLCLLESWFVFSEGVICILMAAPLFYGFAILAAVVTDLLDHKRMGRRAFSLVILPVAAVWMGPSTLPAPVQVTRSVIVDASPTEVARRLAAPREVELPRSLELFPQPVDLDTGGFEVGDTRAIWFAGGEGKPGWFVTEIVERTAYSVVYETVDDRSHLAHWLDWQRDKVTWHPVEGGTEVSWTTRYQSQLAPDWYFGPAEQLAVQVALDTLLEVHTAP